jgi:hypothetical protein
MPTAHLYLFSDACPTDWLADGQGDKWHTIVNFVFQSSPDLQPRLEGGAQHVELLGSDSAYVDFVRRLESELPSNQLRKWKTGPGYRARFCRAFGQEAMSARLLVSACSFQERTLRASRRALVA